MEIASRGARLRVEPEWSQGHYYVVRDLDTGRVVAQGAYEMCERRAAGESGWIVRQGDLFAPEVTSEGLRNG